MRVPTQHTTQFSQSRLQNASLSDRGDNCDAAQQVASRYTQCIQFSGRTVHAGKLVKPHDLFDRCVKENPVWWLAQLPLCDEGLESRYEK